MASSALQVGDEIADSMAAVARAVQSSTKEALRDAGKTAKTELETSMRRQVGSLRLRNMRGAKLGVRTRVTADAVTVSPSGPVGILEPGAAPHTIGVKGRPLKINGRVIRGPVKHPGTRDTRAWSIGQDATFEAVGRDLPKTVGDAVEGAFGG